MLRYAGCCRIKVIEVIEAIKVKEVIEVEDCQEVLEVESTRSPEDPEVETKRSVALQFSTLVEPQPENVIVYYEFSYFHSKDFSNFWSEVRYR